jgi:hypothetical protein
LLGHPTHQQRGERHGPNGEQDDGTQLGAKVSPHGEISAGQQERRQEQHHDEIGIEFHRRRTGHRREHHAADHQGGRRRKRQAPANDRQYQRNRQQPEDQFKGLERIHAAGFYWRLKTWPENASAGGGWPSGEPIALGCGPN